MYEMTILGPGGDLTLTWDPNDSASVEEAARTFDDLLGKGYEAYSKGTTRRSRVKKFDAKKGSLILAPGARPKADVRRGKRPRAMSGGPTTVSARGR